MTPTDGATDDLAALDAALGPVRRTVGFAHRRGASAVRFVEATVGRWLDRAIAAQPPPAAQGLLVALRAAVAGFDTLPAHERDARVADLYGGLAALDRMLGLPLPFQLTPAAVGDLEPSGEGRAMRAPRRAAEESTGRRGTSRRSSRKVKAPAPEPAPVEPPAAATAVRWADDAVAGADLADLESPDDAIDALAALGISRVGQLLARPPTGEEVIEPVLGAGRLQEPGRCAVGGRARRRWTVLRPDGTRSTWAILQGAGPLRVVWREGAPDWVIERFAPDARAVLVGQVEIGGDGDALLVEPELAFDDGRHAVHLPRYALDGVDDAVVRALVQQGLDAVDRLVEPLPAEILQRRSLVGLPDALSAVHTRGDRGGAGARRLTYDEALLAMLAMQWNRFQGPRERGLSHALLHRQASSALQRADVALTDEQQLALEDIKRDLRAATPMRRVLTGEVGGGKGLVALLSTLIVAENKSQVLVLAPDAATAEQRFAFTEPVLRELGFVARLFTDAPTRSQRDAIKRGEVHVVYGTSELLSADLEFRRLGLVVAGERDCFGAIGPRVDALRSPPPDLLVITSTPVATRVLLAAYPAFDYTVLRAAPGRPVACRVVPAVQRDQVYREASDAVRRGEQVMVVFPMSRGADALDAPDALRIVATLESRVFPGARVRLFHGSMSRDDRYATWAGFRDRAIDVLLTTTHFEAGPAVPGASLVIVEQADRMSLSRLHRVRGHVAGSFFEPRCVLVTGEDPDPEGVRRVEQLAASEQGFDVAEDELAQRGLPAMVAEITTELPQLAWLDPARDLDVLLAARADARSLLDDDPGLRRGPYTELARYLRARWPDLLSGPCPVQVSGPAGRRRRRRRRR